MVAPNAKVVPSRLPITVVRPDFFVLSSVVAILAFAIIVVVIVVFVIIVVVVIVIVIEIII